MQKHISYGDQEELIIHAFEDPVATCMVVSKSMFLTSDLYDNLVDMSSYKKISAQEECQQIQEDFVFP
jgi:hypothetical protein